MKPRTAPCTLYTDTSIAVQSEKHGTVLLIKAGTPRAWNDADGEERERGQFPADWFWNRFSRRSSTSMAAFLTFSGPGSVVGTVLDCSSKKTPYILRILGRIAMTLRLPLYGLLMTDPDPGFLAEGQLWADFQLQRWHRGPTLLSGGRRKPRRSLNTARCRAGVARLAPRQPEASAA
jgi:hypothetical protein